MLTYALFCALALIGIVGLYLLLDLSLTLRKTLGTLERIEEKSLPYPSSWSRGMWSGMAVAPAIGYSIWVFREGRWRLEENRCLAGFEPGAPPAVPGTFRWGSHPAGRRSLPEMIDRRGVSNASAFVA